MFNTRIRVPATARRGEQVEIRTMIMHPMDNGFTYTTQGTVIPQDIITEFTCHYLDEEVLHIRLEPGISANPYFTFPLRAEATRHGPLSLGRSARRGDRRRGRAGGDLRPAPR